MASYSVGHGATEFASYTYTYDEMGRITSDGTYTYVYDELGQLVTVKDSSGATVESYTYDGAGNILSANKNGTSHSYTYGNTNWRDQLTAYDGTAITYDAIGNPLSYRGWTFTWQNGRQLATANKSGTSISYAYDVDGLRYTKTVNGVVHSYIYSGGTLLQEKYGTTVLNFLYDADGTPYALQYSTDSGSNFTTYYYITNDQGDVVGLMDASGTLVVSYTYDAWGALIGTTGSLASTIGTINPLRYRSYYYDTETSLYYLQSRYYDAGVGRFVNSDDPSYLGVDGSVTSHNLFVYCNNSPLNFTDSAGNWSLPNWAKVAIGVTIIAAAAVVTIATGGAAAGTLAAAVHCVAQGALVGAVTQAAVGAATGAVTGAVTHRVTTGSWDGAGQAAADGAATGFMTGAITGAVTGAVSSPYCFVAGTTVLTAAGAAFIETIEAGDIVWAWDEETRDIALKEVVETYVNETNELVHVFVDGEEIISTPAHPFYSPTKGWTDAAHLRAGDVLVLVNGEYVVVEWVQHEILEAPVKVYNFHVEDYHTYYVSNIGVLVHNTCVQQNNPGATGQAHHPISRGIEQAASQNPNLRGSVTRNGWGTIRANTLADHYGYQAWHRNFDRAAISWINKNPSATLGQYVGFMNRLYGSAPAVARFGSVLFR